MNTDSADVESRRKLGEVIARRMDDIEARWLADVRRELEASHVDPTALRDGIRDYLALLSAALQEGRDTAPASNGLAAWEKVAFEHGLTRVRLGFDVDQLMREFTLLRRVIMRVARENGLDDCPSEALTEMIGAAVESAVSSYVYSRDYQSRKVEAQHIGFVTHELRNPLTTAMVAGSQLGKVKGLPRDARRPLEIMTRSLQRLRKLIDQVLDVERLEAGEREAQPVPTSLTGILDVAVEHARSEAAARGVALELPTNRDIALHVDPELTISVVQNLVDNAVKYTDQGTVQVTVEERSESIVLHVRDNCAGISDEELAVVFEPFRRGILQHTKPGAGLGLAIAKRAAEAQGGAVGAESKEERGCHFWFELPRQVKRPAARQEERHESHPDH